MKTLKTFAFVSLLTLGLTQSVFAAWWNPFTWHFGWLKRSAPTTQVVVENKSDTEEESLQLTYSSTTKGFLFKYPNTKFEVREGVDNVSVYPVPQPIEFGPVLNIKITKISKANLESEVNNFINIYKQVLKKSEVIVNGTKWSKVEYKDISGAGPEFDYVAYFTIYNNELYRAQYNLSTEANNIAFEKIVSTLKFTEVVDPIIGRACGGGAMGNSGACPNGYVCDIKSKGPPAEGVCKKSTVGSKVYLDTDNGFSFNHPADIFADIEKNKQYFIDRVMFLNAKKDKALFSINIQPVSAHWPDLTTLVNDQYLSSKGSSDSVPAYRTIADGLNLRDIGLNNDGHTFVGQLNQNQFIIFYFKDESLVDIVLSSFKISKEEIVNTNNALAIPTISTFSTSSDHGDTYNDINGNNFIKEPTVQLLSDGKVVDSFCAYGDKNKVSFAIGSHENGPEVYSKVNQLRLINKSCMTQLKMSDMNYSSKVMNISLIFKGTFYIIKY